MMITEAFNATECNSIESRLRRVTPVGVFAESDTPAAAPESGIADLAGNVWEWTGSVYRPYSYQANDGREAPEEEGRRVLRGGSWFSFGGYCRSAYRLYYDPSYRNDHYGFRLARGH